MSASDVYIKVKEIELESLLDITRAINANKSEEALYRMYKFTTRSHPAVAKLALYVSEKESWHCRVHFGSEKDYSGVPLPEEALFFTESGKYRLSRPPFDEFDLLLPIKHKKDVYAYLFVGLNAFYRSEKNILDLNFIQALTNIIIVAVENKKLALEEKKRREYHRQLEVAASVQGLLFPHSLPYDGRIKLEASYFPHHNIGGDYYDYIRISPHEFLLCIADVSGKGVPAALIMSNFQGFPASARHSRGTCGGHRPGTPTAKSSPMAEPSISLRHFC